MRRFYSLLLLIPGLAGCTPESVVWSPDGQVIAVATSKGIYLADSNQNTGPLIDVRPWAETPIVWLPDSKSLLVVHQQPVENWAELETILGPDRAAQAKEHAQKIVAHAETFAGDWNSFDVPGTVSRPVLVGAWAWLGHTNSPGLKKSMKGDEFGNSSEWEKVKSFKPKVHRISLYSVNGLEASFQKNIFETIEMIWSARLSSDGRYLASVITQCLSMKNDSLSVVDSFERPDLSLWISSMDDPKQRMKLAENAGVWTAWSPTGNSLAFLSVDRWATNEGRTLATLRHWEVDPLVMQTTGDVPPNSTELLQLAALPFTKLSMLPDGKILVAAEEVTLPWVPSKQFESPFLYLIDPKFPSRLTKISPRLRDEDFDQALLIGSFQVSPDGQQLAFTSKDSGTGILTIATGEVTWVEPPVEEKSGSGGIQTPSPIAPSWNKSGEFVYLAPGKSTVTKSDRAELVLWGPNKLVNLSQKWEWFEPFR